MAAELEEQEPFEYEEGRWEWDDPDHGGWAKFDNETSQQIEQALKGKIDEGVGSFKGKVEVTLSKGSFFGKSSNKGVYAVVLDMGWNGTHPIVNAARQTNVKTGFKRSIRRVPGLDPPLTTEHKQVWSPLHSEYD